MEVAMWAPDFTSLVVVVLGIAVLGQALDALLKAGRLSTWRKGMTRLWAKLNTPDAHGLTQDAHGLFRDLFDVIYGRRTFSRRRILASVLSTFIALTVLTLILGYENTFWRIAVEDSFYPVFDWETLVVVAAAPLVLNLIPDFFSLMETRWVLKQAEGKSLGGVFAMLLLDIGLTLAIFFAGLLLMYAVNKALILFVFANPEKWGEHTLRYFFTWAFEPWGGLVFLLTTFVTSLLWLLYVVSFILIWLMHRLLPAANYIYYEVGRSERPALAASALLNGVVILAYVLWKALVWVLAA